MKIGRHYNGSSESVYIAIKKQSDFELSIRANYFKKSFSSLPRGLKGLFQRQGKTTHTHTQGDEDF